MRKTKLENNIMRFVAHIEELIKEEIDYNIKLSCKINNEFRLTKLKIKLLNHILDDNIIRGLTTSNTKNISQELRNFDSFNSIEMNKIVMMKKNKNDKRGGLNFKRRARFIQEDRSKDKFKSTPPINLQKREISKKRFKSFDNLNLQVKPASKIKERSKSN